MNVSIIIVNYNTSEHVRKCLDSIFYFTKDMVFEVIVVDNNSPDRRIEELPKKYDSVKFIFRNINDGFGAGCNDGAKYSAGKYYLFLNPDIILKDNAVKKFYDFMEKNADVGLSSGLLVDSEGEPGYTYNDFPSVSWEFKVAISRNTDKRMKELLDKLLTNKSEAFEVDWVMGACMFMRSELFNILNGFDDSFFLYYEDVDLEFRLDKLGYKIVILQDIRLIHHERSSVRSDEGTDVYLYNMHKSKIMFMNKHYSFIKRNFIRLLYIHGMIIRIITNPFRKDNLFNQRQAFNVLKMYLNLLK